jgi:hypothetical protein
MRLPFLLLLAVLLTASPAEARMGDSLAQTLFRYGQPVAATGKYGLLTSTRTFQISGLQITCGYLNGAVVMETIVNPTRDFLPAEVEALLRSESQKKNWTLPDGGLTYTDGRYTRVDGVTATVAGNQMQVESPSWTKALTKDTATEKKWVAEIAAGNTNAIPTAPVNPTTETSAATTIATDGRRPTAADVNSTNAP